MFPSSHERDRRRYYDINQYYLFRGESDARNLIITCQSGGADKDWFQVPPQFRLLFLCKHGVRLTGLYHPLIIMTEQIRARELIREGESCLNYLLIPIKTCFHLGTPFNTSQEPSDLYQANVTAHREQVSKAEDTRPPHLYDILVPTNLVYLAELLKELQFRGFTYRNIYCNFSRTQLSTSVTDERHYVKSAKRAVSLGNWQLVDRESPSDNPDETRSFTNAPSKNKHVFFQVDYDETLFPL